MLNRTLSTHILALAKQYPVVTLTGPRQSGKTTLIKNLFKNKTYLSLEDPDHRLLAQKDPRAFLNQYKPNGCIIDEAQRVGELCSYIQTIVDNSSQKGQFILTGSQNFQLINTITQSLAGRTALLTLLPLSLAELKTKLSISEIIYHGFYPRIHHEKLNPTQAYKFYTDTYIEKDLRQLINIQNLSSFETFIRLCASMTGQIVNLSNLANDCGISHNTAKSWLSILEASYIIHLLRPHHKNFRKRLIKSPKLYFVDTGLACYLLDIKDARHVDSHPLRGSLFETMIIGDILKSFTNTVQTPRLSYFRDNTGHEIDLILDSGLTQHAIEIKSGKTFNEDFCKGLNFYRSLNSNVDRSTCIYGGMTDLSFHQHQILSFNSFNKNGLSFLNKT